MQPAYGFSCKRLVAKSRVPYGSPMFSDNCGGCLSKLKRVNHGKQLSVPRRNTFDVYIEQLQGTRRICICVSPHGCIKDVDFARSCQTVDNVGRQIDNVVNSQQSVLRKSSPKCCQVLRRAARYACNDAKLVNARAREGIVLLARGFERLDKRARQDVALLGTRFLKLDARARQDTCKLDSDAREKAAHLKSIAEGLSDKAQATIKLAAEEHWSDGALDADLRLADMRAKRRAMEDSYIALQLVKSFHNGMLKTVCQRQDETDDCMQLPEVFMKEDGNRAKFSFSESLQYDRLTALQDAYWGMASTLVEADGIDYTDPDEVEFIVAALLDMDAVDGSSSASLLSECAKSPDVATRQALANALGHASSMWVLGNAGIGALQRLAQDSYSEVAIVAQKALNELQRQWQMDSTGTLISHLDSNLLDKLNVEVKDSDDDTERG